MESTRYTVLIVPETDIEKKNLFDGKVSTIRRATRKPIRVVGRIDADDKGYTSLSYLPRAFNDPKVRRIVTKQLRELARAISRHRPLVVNEKA
jgi:hypothetical protein